ncbi:MAG: GAF domain-containing protein [Candidatus Cloacimonetes bacterium]|nr:GAF domain-containing protein [Candidatus Cloacimonadota bacterium]
MTKKNKNTFTELEHRIDKILQKKASMLNKLQNICKLLKEDAAHYDWVGFYFVDRENHSELILGPFEGAPTEHTRIPFGQGVCGQVAKDKKSRIVQDTAQEENYLSCSINVQSEIVVPIIKDGTFIGEIDIDSHTIAAFSDVDEVFLHMLAKKVSGLL